jgi:hypothetical protein
MAHTHEINFIPDPVQFVVLVGYFKEFKEFCYQHDFNTHDPRAFAVMTLQNLQGRSFDSTVEWYETSEFRTRGDADEIIAYAHRAGMKELIKV